MRVFWVCVTMCFIHLGRTEELKDNKPDEMEAQQILNETIVKYGLPEDYKKLGLPGPELVTNGQKSQPISKFVGEPGNYTIKIPFKTKHFSYNGRYEAAHLKKVGSQEIPVVKGQFVEHFKGKKGGFYIRTIGYTLDEKGYREFLIDLSTAAIKIEWYTIAFFNPTPGGPTDARKPISTTVLATLIGGNALG